MTDAQKLQETTVEAALSEARVDAESGMIEDVAVIGTVSQNGRRYQRSALQAATDKYSDTKVFLDHEEGDPMDRSVRDLVGRLKRPRFANGKIKADLQILSREPERSLVTSLAEEMPDAVGLSHSARGKVRQTDEGQVVTEITRVTSVDLVAEPATTSSLFESVQQDRRLDLGREALEEAGADEELIAEVPGFHLESIGAAEDEGERLARAEDLIESVEHRGLGNGRPAGGGVAARSRERDPGDDLEPGTEQYDESLLGEVHDELLGF